MHYTLKTGVGSGYLNDFKNVFHCKGIHIENCDKYALKPKEKKITNNARISCILKDANIALRGLIIACYNHFFPELLH